MPPEPSLQTTQLHHYLDRLQAGDRQAADALVQAVSGRMMRLAQYMLRGFPRLRAWADSDDVLQGALVRLLRALQVARPSSTRELARLTATHIRRELLDLARRFRSRPDARSRCEEGSDVLRQAAAPEEARDQDLDLWAAFHEKVEQLPVEEREVLGLTFYHGWTQAEIAELFGVDERTIRRRWRKACQRLGESLGGRLPQL